MKAKLLKKLQKEFLWAVNPKGQFVVDNLKGKEIMEFRYAWQAIIYMMVESKRWGIFMMLKYETVKRKIHNLKVYKEEKALNIKN